MKPIVLDAGDDGLGRELAFELRLAVVREGVPARDTAVAMRNVDHAAVNQRPRSRVRFSLRFDKQHDFTGQRFDAHRSRSCESK